jgi:hypothetical protein
MYEYRIVVGLFLWIPRNLSVRAHGCHLQKSGATRAVLVRDPSTVREPGPASRRKPRYLFTRKTDDEYHEMLELDPDGATEVPESQHITDVRRAGRIPENCSL